MSASFDGKIKIWSYDPALSKFKLLASQ